MSDPIVFQGWRSSIANTEYRSTASPPFAAFECIEKVRRQRRIEVIWNREEPNIRAKDRRDRWWLEGNQPGNRFSGPRDDDLLASLDFGQQLGEVGFSFVDIYQFHLCNDGLIG